MTSIDLFSGYGGIALGLKDYATPICYCEKDKYAQAILISRMKDEQLPNAPIWDDICSFPSEHFAAHTDIITGGFPCQDISVAGHRKGLGGERSSLFFNMFDVVKKVRPSFVFLENVPNIRTKGLNRIVKMFTDIRYDCRWTVVSAGELGAPHLRKRWFMLAYNSGKRLSARTRKGICEKRQATNAKKFSNTSREGMGWQTEPSLYRVDDGTPHRLDRIKALGNGVVPLQAKIAFERLIALK